MTTSSRKTEHLIVEPSGSRSCHSDILHLVDGLHQTGWGVFKQGQQSRYLGCVITVSLQVLIKEWQEVESVRVTLLILRIIDCLAFQWRGSWSFFLDIGLRGKRRRDIWGRRGEVSTHPAVGGTIVISCLCPTTRCTRR